ncbi:heavy-metal-associated domain-containing protein [Frankia sp. CNm7]|uniref:Heavy-metal-associated domain-containing protein n=1 Tax=Frankia nepalensis TaxID=1836974 RepID=A0A937RLZ3_9ACTN|nr:heavy-metal-associated domain-containing protein [Frankia nepalensis]MBL7501073.1 heavy-metal-associated domain-containing protein [Frankia nepalensis]MBL7512548.1 heavy-metal-associated domain-containing protein [Frankia nepalensis]MBL7518683.1 heavy-metal-associated domain-containing protein [Frankia nepalensis]MBL7632832.1 heavy-metal-associated domain-containing protein [Frankia nepalensis]
MNVATRLGAYAAGLALLFGGAFAAGAAVVPDSTVVSWTNTAQESSMDHTSTQASAGAPLAHGLSIEQDGYLLGEVAAPSRVGKAGALSFQIQDGDDNPLTAYATSHDKDLHLIVVRSDGTQFRHVHPTMSSDGTWSIPWMWNAAGTYRVFADFVPADRDTSDAPDVTLTRTIDVAGDVTPAPATHTSTTSQVDGFTASLHGELRAGEMSDLTVEITRAGAPVTTLQPYLGAFGHLVALRAGDLTYLHVHPQGGVPAASDLSGPKIGFMAEVPTEGRYLLYLDFQVDGQVHTATFVVDTTSGTSGHAGTDVHTGH